MSQRRTVLFVLSDEQRAEYEREIADLEKDDRDFLWQTSGEDALDSLGEIDPCLVIVGMEIGTMEGLEFLAMLLARYPDFQRPVVVLPEKSDKFPAIAHTRNLTTGHSSSDEIAFGDIGRLIGEASPSAAVSPPAAEVASSSPAFETDAQPEADKETEAPRPQGSRRNLAAALVPIVLVVGAVGIYFAFFHGGRPASPPKAKPLAAAPKIDQGVKPTARPPKTSPVRPDAAVTHDLAVRVDTGPNVDLSRPSVLSVTFGPGLPEPRARAKLAEELKTWIAALRRDPKASVELTGHTSSEGSDTYNRKLGMERAAALKVYFVRAGVSARRIVLKSGGASSPQSTNDTELGRSKNRRVTARLLSAP